MKISSVIGVHDKHLWTGVLETADLDLIKRIETGLSFRADARSTELTEDGPSSDD